MPSLPQYIGVYRKDWEGRDVVVDFMSPGSAFYLGVDLGQAQDPTAIAVVERVDRCGDFDHVHWVHKLKREYHLRHLERVPLGTNYLDVVERVKEVWDAKGMK